MQRPGPPSLLYLQTDNEIGGAARAVVNLHRQFVARGWHVRTVFPDVAETETLVDWAREQGVEIERNPAVGAWYQPRSPDRLAALFRLVAESNPAIVHLWYGAIIRPKDMLAVRLARPSKCIVSLSTSMHGVPRAWRPLTALAAQLSDRVVVLCEAHRTELLENRLPRKNVVAIYPGVCPPADHPSQSDARARLGIPDSAFVVATYSRLEQYKGTADLLEAVARIPDPNMELMCVVAGEGPERANLERLGSTRLNGRVRFLGHVSRHADLYAASNVFAMPSRTSMETFGLVFVEAAFHSVPSIGTNVGGIPEAIVDGRTGLLVAPRDPDALAAAIIRLREDAALRYGLGETARARAYATFTEVGMANRYERLYRSCSLLEDGALGHQGIGNE
jgi:glycosyltransferase involved in cell wall biosynthesis